MAKNISLLGANYPDVPAVQLPQTGGGTAAFERLNQFFLMNNMVVAGSQYWNIVHGNSPDEVRQDAEGLQVMRSLAANIAWLMKCLDAANEAGIERPQYETRQRTNFIR